MPCYLRRPLLSLISWCPAFVCPPAALTLHSQWRIVASFKQVFCCLSISSQENEGCCSVEERDGLYFHEAHPGTSPPVTTDVELTMAHLCQDCIFSS